MILLAFLTITAAAYNYQFFSIPHSMFLNAHKLPEWETPPAAYLDVTEDLDFRVRVIDYVLACDIIHTGMQIEEYDIPYDWLKNASNSSQGYDMTVKFFDDYYFLQVRYYPDFLRTYLEYSILWTIDIITGIAWVLVAIQSLRNPNRETAVK